MQRFAFRVAPTINLRALHVARVAPSMLQPAARPAPAVRAYASAALDPEKNYDAFVDQWLAFFREVDDETDLEVGLNECFVHDWVPALGVVEEALKATRRLNSFPTAVRILEGIEERAENKGQYEQYVSALKPMLEELGVPTKKELGF
ncbi:cytochrome c oxidase, subunit VA/VI [Hyaloraphidium curvatum]|nr:cytochrome c oxidase, subunit VA/VI [Hyaloraphidium curvatum]